MVTAKVAIDIKSDAPYGFNDFFYLIEDIEDEEDEDYELIWEGLSYHSVKDLVFDHPDYFTIRWFEGVDVEPNLDNLYRIQYVF